MVGLFFGEGEDEEDEDEDGGVLKRMLRLGILGLV